MRRGQMDRARAVDLYAPVMARTMTAAARMEPTGLCGHARGRSASTATRSEDGHRTGRPGRVINRHSVGGTVGHLGHHK